jgi:hypothetical protein
VALKRRAVGAEVLGARWTPGERHVTEVTMHPPGWYPDPAVHGQERWWGGQAFTEHVRPTPGPVPLTPSVAPTGMLSDVMRQADIRADLASGKNSHASMAFVFALLSVVGFGLGWVIGIVFGILGLRRAREYAAAGYPAIGRSKSVWALALSVVGIVVTVALVVSAVRSQPSLTSEVVESAVTRQLLEQTGVAVTVACPDLAGTTTGDRVACVATEASGVQHPVDVTVEDDAGGFTWRTD